MAERFAVLKSRSLVLLERIPIAMGEINGKFMNTHFVTMKLQLILGHWNRGGHRGQGPP